MVELSGDTAVVLRRARRRVARQGIKLNGDEAKGAFSGIFTGSYEVVDHRARVTIDRKPFFVTWDIVERFLRDTLTRTSKIPDETLETAMARPAADVRPPERLVRPPLAHE